MNTNEIGVNTPLVTIQCLVYNHEPYLRQCLDGFVMQKTNFKFEAIVHDDCSTDGSVIIIKEYVEKYPDIIKPIYETENQYSKHNGSLAKIMNEHTHGRYVAKCEGDDYWIDPLKLQKQVDFMKQHPSCSMVFHRARILCNSDEYKKVCSGFQKIENRIYSGEEIFKEWIVPTASVMCKLDVLKSSLYLKCVGSNEFTFGDILIFLSSVEMGEVWGMTDTMSVYRRHTNGVSFSLSIEERIKLVNHYIAIWKYFGARYKKIAINKSAQVIASTFIISIIDFIKGRASLNFRMFHNNFKMFPLPILKNIIMELYKHSFGKLM